MLRKISSYSNTFKSRFTDPANRKIFSLIGLAIVVVALPIIILVAQQQQRSKQHASELVTPPYPSPIPVVGFGKAASFGNYGYINVYDQSLKNFQDVSIEAWVKLNDKTNRGGGTIFSKKFVPNQNSGDGIIPYALSVDFNNKLIFKYSYKLNDWWLAGELDTANNAITDNVWTRLAVKFSGNQIGIYVNGQMIANKQQTGPIGGSYDSDLSLGNNTMGQIDEFQIVSPSSATDMSGGPYKVDYWTLMLCHFDEISGSNTPCSNSSRSSINAYSSNVTYVASTVPFSAPTPIPSQSPPIPASASYSRVFVTSTVYNGNLGGIEGADAKCQARAGVSNLGGTWKAWISGTSDSSSPSNRFYHSTVPYKSLNNVIIAKDWNDLVNGQKTLSVNEFAKDVSTQNAWTNTLYTGKLYFSNPRGDCNEWTSADPTLSASSAYGPSYSYLCDYNLALYCFEQPASTPTPTPALTGKTPPCGNYGDVFIDGVVNLVDANLIAKYLVGNTTLTDEQKKFADVTKDGKVNISDSLFISQYSVGSRKTFPVCQ